jgi:hypothetical protein
MSIKTIVALFEHRRDSVRAVRELLAHGISKDRISLVSPTTISDAGRIHLPLEDDEHDERSETSPMGDRAPDDVGMPPSTTAGVGTTVGIGSVLLGVAFLSLPAVGPVLAAGPLLTGIMASGAGVGGMDLPHRLSETGMPPSDAERFARAVRRGAVLVVLTVSDEDVDDAAVILARHRPVDPEVVREHPRTSWSAASSVASHG